MAVLDKSRRRIRFTGVGMVLALLLLPTDFMLMVCEGKHDHREDAPTPSSGTGKPTPVVKESKSPLSAPLPRGKEGGSPSSTNQIGTAGSVRSSPTPSPSPSPSPIPSSRSSSFSSPSSSPSPSSPSSSSSSSSFDSARAAIGRALGSAFLAFAIALQISILLYAMVSRRKMLLAYHNKSPRIALDA